MDKLDHLGWVVQHTYEIGGVRYGIRSTSEEFGAALDEALERYRSDQEASPAYSIVVGEDAAGGDRKEFHILYRGSMSIVRSLNLRDVVAGLLSELHAPLFAERDDALYLRAGIVSSDGATALVPEIVASGVATLGRRLERTGLTVSPERWVAIDPGSGSVIPVPRLLEVPEDAVARVASVVAPNGLDGSTAAPGSIDVVCVFDMTEEMPAPSSRGKGVSLLASQTLNLAEMGGRALEALARLVGGARVYRLRYAVARDHLDALAKAMSSA